MTNLSKLMKDLHIASRVIQDANQTPSTPGADTNGSSSNALPDLIDVVANSPELDYPDDDDGSIPDQILENVPNPDQPEGLAQVICSLLPFKRF